MSVTDVTCGEIMYRIHVGEGVFGSGVYVYLD